MRKTRSNFFAILFTLAGVIFGLCACSSSDSDDNNSGNGNGGGTDTPPIEEPYDGITLTKTVAANYTVSNELGNYTLALAVGELDENDMPATTGSMMMQIDLFAAVDGDTQNATLPNGTYQAGKNEAFTFNPSYTYAVLRTEEATAESDGLTMLPLTSGDITVSRDGDTYTIDINCTLISGDSLKARFTGPLAFTYTASSQYEKFTETQNITFTNEQGRYWGNFFYPHCDDMAMQFFTGTVDTNGNLTDGYYLYIPAFMPKLADYNMTNPPLSEGVYDVRPTKSQTINWIPYEIQQGKVMTIFERETVVGAYLMRIDGATGKRYLGLLDSGTMKVTKQDNTYSIVFDFATAEGIAIKGTYNGRVTLTNYNDNDTNQNNVPRPWSQLTENISLNFNEWAEASVFFLGQDLKQGYNSWLIYILDMKNERAKDDYITVELLTPVADGMALASREYVISNELGAYLLIPGFQKYGGGEVAYSWYGDMNSVDDEGYATKLAPINGGTMTLQKNSEDNYTFVFDFVDDAGHTIKGTWTGTTGFYDMSQQTTSAKRHKPVMNRQGVKPIKLLKVRR